MPRHWMRTFFCLVLLAGPARAVELRVGVPFPKDTPQGKATDDLVQEIDTATKGEVKLVLSSFRPGEGKVVKEISAGKLDAGLVMGRGLADLHQDAFAYAVPFTFASRKQVDFLRRKLDAEVLKNLSAGPHEALCITEFGFAYMMSTQAVASPDELRKRKIWVPANGELAECLGGLGLKTVALPAKGVKKALADGTADTVIALPELTIMKRWHRKIKNVLDRPFVYIYGVWIVSDKAFAGLSAEQQSAVRKCLSSYNQKLGADFRKRDNKGREVLKRFKIEFVALDEAMQKQWGQWAKDVWQHLGKGHKPTAGIEKKLKECLRASEESGKEEEPAVQPDRSQ